MQEERLFPPILLSRRKLYLLAWLTLLAALPAILPVAESRHSQASAQSHASARTHFEKETADIRALLSRQAADWNRGDLDAFASGYKNSPDILFIGRKISRGYDGMLATYKQGYATREAMGTLTFSQLEVQPLDAQFATVTGHFHLERTQAGGGNADGYFLLVVENTASGWKIVRDDTTALPQPAAH